jgi:hypothetical protein
MADRFRLLLLRAEMIDLSSERRKLDAINPMSPQMNDGQQITLPKATAQGLA